jgi:FkbM family methyltransferase
MISFLLKSKFIRDKVKFSFLHYYFHELNFSIPVGSNYYAHLLESDSYDSFSEIFINKEYEKFIPNESILTILDLGANYGYFSLWLQSTRSQDRIHSKLVEPSSRCSRSLEKLVNLPQLQKRFQYLPLAIANPNEPYVMFFDRPFMAGSIFETNHTVSSYTANSLKISDALKSDNSSYDLIKCDIEGGEWDFLIYYSPILVKSKFLVMEWHSWHSGGGGFSQIEKKLSELKYQIIKSGSPQKAVGRDGEVGLFLAKNLNFKN